MEQLMELLANCYSPELGLRCRPCCFSQNNSGASPLAVQVLTMRTAHMNLHVYYPFFLSHHLYDGYDIRRALAVAEDYTYR